MNLAALDLNLLKILDALLAERSVTRAASRVNLSQPATSAALARLRDRLGDPLLVRQGNTLVATPFAESLQEPLARTLEQLKALLETPARFDPAKATGSTRISGFDFFSEMLMPQLIARLSREAPRMQVQHFDLLPNHALDMIKSREIDIGLVPPLDFPEWLDTRPVLHSRLCVVARRDHPRLATLAEWDEVPVGLFCDLDHVLCSPSGSLTGIGDDALAEMGHKRRVIMSTPFFSSVLAVVSGSDAIALVPYQLAERVRDRMGLRLLTPPMPLPLPRILIAWHRRNTPSPAHRWMRETVADILIALNPGGTPPPED